LALTATVAAAAQWLVLPQPAAARGASSQKVDPQLLAAFQEALSANSYEVNSIAGLMLALVVCIVPCVFYTRLSSQALIGSSSSTYGMLAQLDYTHLQTAENTHAILVCTQRACTDNVYNNG
jgi:hypothetical protein